MTTVTVCVGSSCHIRGAHDVIKKFDQIVRERKLQDDILLKGSFCMEHCTEGISIKIDNEFYSVKNLDVALELFQKEVLDVVNLR
ncbi:(2Fe-2S) ferredoxin domain-containing protein [bacterium]|nr:(2Fe-2S) ferredoxin domain-containing protein [bacterium]